MITACEKVIGVWDLVTLQNIGTLRGHKDEIRAMHIAENLLVSGGKGSTINGAIFFWDLRSQK